MKLGSLPTVLESVVLPPCLARPPVDGVDDTVTGTDDYEVSRDRGGREDSAAGLVLPQDPASGRGTSRQSLVTRYDPRPKGGSEPENAW